MKNLILKIAILTLLLGAISACHTQRYYTNDKAVYGYKSAANVKRGRSDFFVGGIGQTDKIDAVSICKGEDNVQAVETKLTFLQGLVGALTLSIYTPREYTVYCK